MNNPLIKEIKKLEDVGIKHPESIYIAGMLLARAEPYCTIIDLRMFANEMNKLIKEKETIIKSKLYIITGSDRHESFAFYGVCDTEEGAKKLIENIKSKEDYIGRYDNWFKIDYSEIELNKFIKNNG